MPSLKDSYIKKFEVKCLCDDFFCGYNSFDTVETQLEWSAMIVATLTKEVKLKFRLKEVV